VNQCQAKDEQFDGLRADYDAVTKGVKLPR
jgi:hypothetical protein